MPRKQPSYKVQLFLEDGTPLTKENVHRTYLNEACTEFQAKMIIRKLNTLPDSTKKLLFEKLTNPDQL